MAGKIKNLTLKEKYDAIILHEQGESVKQIIAHFNCGKTQIYECLKPQNKVNIKERYDSSINRIGQQSKKWRECKNAELNKILFDWFCVARAKNFPISGPVLQAKAKEIAEKTGNSTFKASNGWLRSFRTRFDIRFKRICGEANDVADDTVALWKSKLKDICKGYQAYDVANCDETAFFFRMLPNKSLSSAKDNCTGGKMSKERVTVMLTVFGDGSILQPLVIGKANRPRCFKNLNKNKLGVDYFSNKKAWMTGAIFNEYLTNLNKKMKKNNRKILLFLDNASSHLDVQLSNVKLVFLPPNTTSILQPLDHGIIAALKVQYRKLMLQHLLIEMENSSSATELAKKITLLDAIELLKCATKKIQTSTVTKCFLNCGFPFDEVVEEVEDVNCSPLIEIQNLIQTACGSAVCSATLFVEFDKEVETEFSDLDEILNIMTDANNGRDIQTEANLTDDDPAIVVNSEDDDTDDESEIKAQDIAKSLKNLVRFAAQMGNSDFFEKVSALKMEYAEIKAQQRKTKQTSILDFF